MYSGRPPTGAANRPGSRGVGTAWGRGGGTSAGPMIPGSGIGVPPQTVVVDRPMTQQGLGGLRSNVQTPGRIIQDVTYFASELRQRIQLIAAELNRLVTEADLLERDSANLAAFEKRAESLTLELKDYQGQLGDYNTLVEKIHTESELIDIERNVIALKAKNERESHNVDDIFSQRQQKEAHIKEIELAIAQEEKKAESRVADMPKAKRDEYFELKAENNKYLAEMKRKQTELDDMTTRTKKLQQELSRDRFKQQAIGLSEKLAELRQKKLELETSLGGSGGLSEPEEREKIMQKMQEDNQEIASLDRKIVELEEQCQRFRDQLVEVDRDLEERKGEKNQKFQLLLARDKEMQDYIDNFESTRTSATERNARTEESIVGLLDHISKNAKKTAASLPNQDTYKKLQGDLQFKEKELENSMNTLDAIQKEKQKKIQDLEKVQQLESKLHTELEHLDIKIGRMQEGIAKFDNLPQIKAEAEAKKKQMLNYKQTLANRKAVTKQMIQALSAKLDTKNAQLNENQTLSQLKALENKLKALESNNFLLSEYIKTKTVETDYRSVAKDIMKMTDECNQQIIQILTMPSLR